MRAVDNPRNRFHRSHVIWLGEPPDARLAVYEQRAGRILSPNTARDLPFAYSCNPYRGCYHACAYCYARASHQYLDLGAGSDFERKLVVKVNAVEALRQAFERPGFDGGLICFSGNTDCYQPLEASYGLTRGCLTLCRDYRNPVTVITKGVLIERDLELLRELSEVAAVSVFISIAFLDDDVARALEPNVAPPSRRLRTLRALSDAGLSTGIAIAPVITGLNDRDIPGLLAGAADAGARQAFITPLRLDPEVEPHFFERVQAALPHARARIERAVREVRRGALAERRPGHRFEGHGARWKLVEDVFALHARRLGMRVDRGEGGGAQRVATFRRPRAQLPLFGE